ncbi:cilia- and flagella-associated protein 90-like [Argopecten irradians]|uniref:cilia- and flagella-associated protein 90-like n=1 Tax=Argopecten irradians TaxID=31199 RepID=UPI00372421E7
MSERLMEGRMSLYGKSSPSPGELAGLWKNVLQRRDRISKRHLATVGDGSKTWTGIKQWSRQMIDEGRDTIYGPRTRNTVADVSTNYKRLFHIKYDYDSKIHRDDRKPMSTTGQAMHEEETRRTVPVLSSSQYGNRVYKPLETFSRTHVCIEHIQKGFYHKRGTGLPPLDP